MAGLDGQKNRLSRRGFLGLAAGAAAAAALPGSVLGLGAPAEDVTRCECEMCLEALQIIKDWRERIAYEIVITPDGLRLPYWQVAADSVMYLGIDRSAS